MTRMCPECWGDKVMEEPCLTCKGRGFLRKKPLFHKEVKLVPCTNKKCKNGATIHICPRCLGLGVIP